jgi:hypothetical protein
MDVLTEVQSTNQHSRQQKTKENADRMILASFMEGLTGETRKHVRISNPQKLGQALDTVIAIQEVLCKEKSKETFYTRTDRSVRLTSRSMYNE